MITKHDICLKPPVTKNYACISPIQANITTNNALLQPQLAASTHLNLNETHISLLFHQQTAGKQVFIQG